MPGAGSVVRVVGVEPHARQQQCEIKFRGASVDMTVCRASDAGQLVAGPKEVQPEQLAYEVQHFRAASAAL